MFLIQLVESWIVSNLHITLVLNLSPYYSTLFWSVSTTLSAQAVTHQDCVSNWGKSSQTMLELFRLNKELQTSVSHSTAAASPPVLQHAVLLLLCMSGVPLLGPRGVPPHIFLAGVGGMCNTFSLPLPATESHPSQNPKQQTYLVTDLSHGSTSLEKDFSLSSGLESPGSSPPPHPSWTVDTQNMCPSAVHMTCGRKPLRLMATC